MFDMFGGALSILVLVAWIGCVIFVLFCLWRCTTAIEAIAMNLRDIAASQSQRTDK